MGAQIKCVCAHCGTPFMRYRSHIRGGNTYCSGACAQKVLAPTRERHWQDIFSEKLWIPEPNSGCWLWLGQLNRLGYGVIGRRAKSKQMFAHRAAYIMAHGSIPAGMDILHRCDVRCCVNPDHLYAGTHTDNMHDMFSKGRRKAARGSAHWAAKLIAEDVLAIRSSSEPHKVLAIRYCVSTHNIHTIRSNRSWRHLSQIPPGRTDTTD